MTELQLLIHQIKMAQEHTLKLVTDLDDKFWKLTPPGVKTNINWQVGHISVRLYEISIVSTGGTYPALKNLIPLSELTEMYKTISSPEDNLQRKPDKEDLLKALRVIFRQADVHLQSMQENELSDPAVVSGPEINTNRDALIWCSHHQMWHNGLISMLKGILLIK